MADTPELPEVDDVRAYLANLGFIVAGKTSRYPLTVDEIRGLVAHLRPVYQQAEAQAPASVLTEIANWKAYIHHEDRIHTTLWLATQLQRAEGFIDRLTVGAPAPAHTMPTSNALQDAISDWAVALPLEIQTPLRGKGDLRKLRDAITDLFAKGGTP